MNFLVEVPPGQRSYMRSELVTLPTEDEGLVPDSVTVTAAAIGMLNDGDLLTASSAYWC